ncbi:MAG: D-glycero-beta-D-manno-heptose 1-phosphate adenylyltransferase [Planctomycetales bacterium]|nr:D-glycero-beta-D-manno-heptose 1-phosphate adenylyltransferase [bacterium]UNM10073.1 MAG: D-glycero-beta-D-manno-heptose 1-phosphate adenylyltransferase [Planctomycetales bacterium]
MAQIDDWRARGLSIVFTNGVFDLLHPGHIEQLRQARSFGDVLIVGINTDESVRRLGKGEVERPILPLEDRITMLEALRMVDAVAPFAEDTPYELLQLILPDVLVKGADYRVEDVVGRDIVEARGGRVELVPLVPGHSTSDIIRRIRK